MIARPQNHYSAYHAHVYFDAHTIAQAEKLCHAAGQTLAIPVGRVHRKLVGPHPHWSCQLSFSAAKFATVIPWLEQHRDGLNILVHGITGNNLADHTDHATWLGEPQPLVLSFFQASSVA
ncbi:MAG: DOPA 4,5-dioxygenase family protein [Cyanobacteria bacterium P01_F01_bin.56]